MKIYVKKSEALGVIPQFRWMIRGTMAKIEKEVDMPLVLDLVKEKNSKWRTYYIQGRYMVCYKGSDPSKDYFYESIVNE